MYFVRHTYREREVKDKKSSESRRKLLKSIAAGSGAIVAGKNLPESWSRPVVDSVMLPAHAQTSPTGPSGGSSGDIELTSIENLNDDSMFARLSDKFISSAHADDPCPETIRWTTCVTPPEPGGNAFIVQVMWLQEINCSGGLLSRETFKEVQQMKLAVGESKIFENKDIDITCGDNNYYGDLTVTLDSYSNGSGSVSLEAGDSRQSKTVNFGPGGCALDSPDCVEPIPPEEE